MYQREGQAVQKLVRKYVFTFASVEPLLLKGKCSLSVAVPQTGKRIVTDFFVTPGKAATQLGQSASESLGVLRVGVSANSCDVKPDRKVLLKEKFPNAFKGLGKLKGYQLKLHVNENTVPVAQPIRRIPLIRREKVVAKIEELEKFNVI